MRTTRTLLLSLAGLALAVYAAATVFDYRWLRTLTWPIYVVNLALLAVTLLLGDAEAALDPAGARLADVARHAGDLGIVERHHADLVVGSEEAKRRRRAPDVLGVRK